MTEKSASQPSNAPQRWVLRPHRSLAPTGFVLLMSAVGLVSFAAGVFFWAIGAWPVFGFFGLDTALIYTAFRLNYRAARHVEVIELADGVITVTFQGPAGEQARWLGNPYWVRVVLRELRGGSMELSLAQSSDRVVVGSFLGDGQRRELAGMLREALAEVRGARRPRE